MKDKIVKVTCRRCNGSGYDSFMEDNRMVSDACYRCGNTGYIKKPYAALKDTDELFEERAKRGISINFPPPRMY